MFGRLVPHSCVFVFFFFFFLEKFQNKSNFLYFNLLFLTALHKISRPYS